MGGGGTVPLPVAGRTVLQMDQAASADQSVLRYFGQRRQDADLDRDLHLRARCDPQEAPQYRTQSLHNATDPERQPLSENRAFTGILTCKVANARGVNMQPVAAIRLIAGRIGRAHV